ncbi:hypothetical protein [Eleftheria terrae]|uniref:hypothetical protein n=1 Tax=Eleftheria terrae TaxID=1597781 RepID=UPI00263A5BEA|nr:hypothetical protein [Eleftheria terrae]WKB50500.1 hypothetical protein N7L95_00190 [Eleftheria terrae]
MDHEIGENGPQSSGGSGVGDGQGGQGVDRGAVGGGGVHAGGVGRQQKLTWLPDNPRGRGEEKLRAVLLWICRFHYSNAAVMMQLLGLKHFTNVTYFSRLVSKGLLKRIEIPTLRRPVYMLTPAGLSTLEGVPEAAYYHVDERRIAASLARHSLAVQRAVLNRRSSWDRVVPERLLKERGKKIPDAVLMSGEAKTALEVELTYKTRTKIYLAFTDHARAIRDGAYAKVEYVFVDPVMRDSYRSAFEEELWPVYRWNEKTRRYDRDREMFRPDSLKGLKEAVTFTVEDLPHD